MNLVDCYRILGLKSGASLDDIKASYRRLARQYHPDVNPGDRRAQDKFIEVTAAYKFLLAQASSPEPEGQRLKTPAVVIRKKTTSANSIDPQPPSKSPSVQFNPHLTLLEQQLKETSYQQLQDFLRNKRFPRAIALVEGLARRIPKDPEIVQWQAIAYQRWGHQLIQEQQLEKARIYLKKALRTDPHNRSLWAEVEKDFREMERLF